jgi:lipoyl(octanoyl) transferase
MLTVRDVSTSLDMTKKIFATLDTYFDKPSRTAAMNMAIDEALLESASAPSIRFYRWDHSALSFGYFGKFADVADQKRDLVRRWTGGGIVLHGEDLTYSLVIPGNDSAFADPSMSIYEKVHLALCTALGEAAIVAAVADRGASRTGDSGVGDPGYNGLCFANPVRADVMMNGRKVAGAAQRRTRRGLLQQGSIQHVDLTPDFEMRFARELSTKPTAQELDRSILVRAHEIAAQKYGSDAWLRKR